MALLHCAAPDILTRSVNALATILRVAVPSPLRQLFDYLPPAVAESPTPQPGVRVRVPFGRRDVIGVVMAVVDATDIPVEQLRAAIGICDEAPILSPATLELIAWAADYYQHPIGECVTSALPVLLRKGDPAIARETYWRLTVAGLALPEGALKRAPQQAAALTLFQQQGALASSQFRARDISPATVRAMVAKGLVERFEADVQPVAKTVIAAQASTSAAPILNDEQRLAVDAMAANAGRFRCHLLEGVTGSGKTEVYLRLLERTLARGEQALVLVPEIGLTPQTLSRFQQRLNTKVVALHSGLNDTERLQAWRAARSGSAGVLLGTRSAVFAEFGTLGLIVIDEEHDMSYKQQDGFRYSARDIAIKRAADAGIPIVLGSATPSLETLHNALNGRYAHLQLQARAGGAAEPKIELLDIRHAPMRDGLSPRAIEAIGETLRRGEQALVFLNRRGYAPTLLCHDCGWIAQCRHCDTRLTVHAGSRQLRCHHCGYRQPLPRSCPSCKSPQLEFRGPGTERLEMALRDIFQNREFPDTPIIRIDRDTTQRKHALLEKIDAINQQQSCILVGTQMLAKGHHFPDVTLVVMVDIDGGLFSADLRGPERMGQMLTQVAGRAGRAEKSGRVLVQTHYPAHELIADLVRTGYHEFARKLLVERRVTGAPPFAYFALLRADARTMSDAEDVLAAMREHIAACDVHKIGPLPAPLSRRAGMFRAQLLVSASQRAQLHHAVQAIVNFAEQLPAARRVKWSVDIDPLDFS